MARALSAKHLVFLTDVDGLMDASGAVIDRLDATRAEALWAAGTIAGGMIPKVEACFRATEGGGLAIMANGRTPGTLRRIVDGEQLGTRIEA